MSNNLHLSISPFSGDNMVIQQGVIFPLCGSSIPDAIVSVSFLGKSIQCKANKDGAWQLDLDPLDACGPFSLEITSNNENITLNNIYAGDVWLCAGQSNMEMPMQRLKDSFPDEWDTQNFPCICQFKVPQEWDFSEPRKELNGGCWKPASNQTLDEFSGAAWFFAKKLFEKNKIPIGLVNTAWGGTPIESWMSREALSAFPGKAALAEMYADQALCKDIVSANAAHADVWESLLEKHDKGLPGKWHVREYDLSKWNDINLPGNFSDAGLTGFCGVVWISREFYISGEFAAQDAFVLLGTIVDADTVYINGIEAGNTAYRYPPSKYFVPAGMLNKGKNRITIRVKCFNGEGGITKDKPFYFFSSLGTVDLAGTWKYRIGACSPPKPQELFLQRQPLGAYNAMIAPVLRYPFKGIIWYQGESNTGNPNEYAPLFKAMIQDWRIKTGCPNLPFLFVQLPVFGSPRENNEKESWPLVRHAQNSVLELAATGMAAGLDLGEWNDLHPVNKKDLGFRLALAAEKLINNDINTSPGPVFREVKKHKKRLIIYFDNCGKGLVCREDPFINVVCAIGVLRLPVEITGMDNISADISVIADISSSNKSLKILYAWADNPKDRQLFNSEGLPVLPFNVIFNE
jgi:sialate O-acetylesterase